MDTESHTHDETLTQTTTELNRPVSSQQPFIAQPSVNQRKNVALYIFTIILAISICAYAFIWLVVEPNDESGESGLMILIMTLYIFPFIIIGILGTITSLIIGNIMKRKRARIIPADAIPGYPEPEIIAEAQNKTRFYRIFGFLIMIIIVNLISFGLEVAISDTGETNPSGAAPFFFIGFFILPALLTVGQLGVVVSAILDIKDKRKVHRVYSKKQFRIIIATVLIAIITSMAPYVIDSAS